MKSIFTTLMITTAMILLSGCGGGGSSPSITDKNYIIIMHDVPSGVCEATLFRDLLVENGFINPLTSEEDNSVSCATYGRDSTTCAEDTIANYDPTLIGDVACVVGFDDFVNVASVSYENVKVKPSLIDATDTIQKSFIQIAE